MVKLAANLSMLFTEIPFLDRFAAAAQAGFKAVEFLFPYDHDARVVAERARDTGVEVVLFNVPAGDWAAGDRGLAALPARQDECRAAIAKALEYADAIGTRRLHLMAGRVAGLDAQEARETFIRNIANAADACASRGIDVMLEPLNTRVDVPGYFYSSTDEALTIIAEVGRANVKLQYDIYHMQIMEGDLARTIERILPVIGHIQLADNPGRNEPGTGEINYPWLLGKLDELGYAGWIGCEYRPATDTATGLAWTRPYLAEGHAGAGQASKPA